MSRYEDLATSLEQNRLELVLDRCAVTRCSEAQPEEYRGAGKLQQDPQGHLYFTMDIAGSIDALIDRLSGGEGLQSGKLLPLSAQFTISGTDANGGEWKSSPTYMDSVVNVVAQTGTITLRPKTWTLTITADPAAQQYRWKVSSDLKPLSRGRAGTTKKQDSFEDDTWSVETDQATKLHSFTYTAVSPDDLERRASLLNKGWSILCGAPLQPHISSHCEGGVEVIKIQKVYRALDHVKLYPFIDPRGGYLHDHLTFIRSWLATPGRYQQQRSTWQAYAGAATGKESFDSPLDDIFQHYYRIQFAFAMDMENAVQVVTAAVEGLINAHAKSFMDGDKTIVEPVRAAGIAINGIKQALDERVLKIVEGALSRASAPTSAAIFERLEAQGVISSELKKGWKVARHRPAHGTLLDHRNDENTQQYIDGFFYNYEIFKRLVFCLIGYSGHHTNIEKPGWPSEAWPPSKP